MKQTVDIKKLVSDAAGGNEDAFQQLYSETYKSAYHTASLLLNNPDDIEDVLQNVYIKAYKKLSELKNPESFESWLKSIVENESKNYIKKERRINAPIVLLKDESDIGTDEWRQPVPQEYMEREDLRNSVSEILDTLSPEVRACIVLFYYEQRSLKEISEILEIPLGTVKTRLYYGKKRIEKAFDKLRKKDPTLYGIGAIPVLLALFAYRAKDAAAVTIPKIVLPTVAGTSATGAAVTVGAAAAASTTATATVAGTGVTATAAVSVATKVAAVALAGSAVVGGSFAIKNHVETQEEKTAVSSVYEIEEPATVVDMITIEQTEEAITFSTERRETTGTTIPRSSMTTRATTQERTTRSTSAKAQDTTRKETTKPTTTKAATTKSTTTKPTTTKKETSTAEQTALEQVTSTTTTTAPAEPETITTTTAVQAPSFTMSGGVLTGYSGTGNRVSIPSSVDSNTVTAIGSGAFFGNEEIVSVTLPSTVTQIGQEAFADCTSLSSVSLPSSLQSVGMGAFYGCSSLTSVNIPNSVQSIGDEAFAYCTSLNTVTIPSDVTSIASDAFSGCDSLTIRCEEGSAAHSFAQGNGINFVLI